MASFELPLGQPRLLANVISIKPCFVCLVAYLSHSARSRMTASVAGDQSAYLALPWIRHLRSEEHTSELQSHHDLVCRLLLEKKNKERTGSPLFRRTH